jgi:hypothetical protein
VSFEREREKISYECLVPSWRSKRSLSHCKLFIVVSSHELYSLKALPRLVCTCLFSRFEGASLSCDPSDDFSVPEIILPQIFSNRIYIDIEVLNVF